MVDTVTGSGLDQSAIADAINRKYVGFSQKQRNQMMQAGTSDPSAFALQNQPQIQQAQQPSQFQGANVLTEISDASHKQNSDIIAGLQGQYGLSNLDWNKTDTTNLDNTIYNNPSQKTTQGLVQDSLRGSSDYKPTLYGGTYQSNEMFPSNPMNAKLRQLFDPIYGNTYNKNMMQSIGNNMGLSQDEIGKLAGIVSGSRYNQSLIDHKTPWEMGGKNTTDAYANILGQFYKAKTGSDMSDAAMTNIKAQTGNIDNYLKQLRSVQAPKNGGLLGEVFNFVDPILDTLDPMHNKVQTWTTGSSTTEGQSPYFQQYFPMILDAFLPGAGSIVGAAQGASTGNTNQALANLASYGISNYAGTPTTTDGGASTGVYGSGYSLGSTAADTLAQNALTNTAVGTIASGGDLGKGLQSGLASGLGGYLSNSTADMLGEVGSKALGGAASGGINSLFTKNSPIQGSLYGAMSGGLYGLLNSTDRNSNNFNNSTDKNNRATANTLTQLVKLLAKRRK